MLRTCIPLALLWSAPIVADVKTRCVCDATRPDSLAARECSLTAEALKQPPDTRLFFLKDNNPRKPNRWLALPGPSLTGVYRLAEMTPPQRTELWAAAIGKAKELWGNEWGLAYNGDHVRTQCHVHIHIGRLIPGVERSNFVIVNTPAEIPVPQGDGLWVHPHGKRLHVHIGEQINETVLFR